MATDLATRSAYSWPATGPNYVLVQLDFSDASTNSGSLFSCQLSINDNSDADSWRTSEFATRIGTGNGVGVVGSICLPRIPVDPQPFQTLVNLSLFGLNSMVTHSNGLPYSINVVARCKSTERMADPARPNQTRVWLAKADIISGGLVFLDGSILSIPFIQRVWPTHDTEPFRGIFFTGSELQIEVGTANAIRRFRLLGVDRNGNGRVKQAVWEHIKSRTVLSELAGEVVRSNGDISSDLRTPQPPAERMDKTFTDFAALCKAVNVAVTRPPGEAGGSPIVCVSDMDTATSTAREFARIDWTVAFDTTAGFAERTLWQPRTLKTDAGDFVLSDADEVEAVLQGAAVRLAAADATLTWGTAGVVVPDLKATRFVGTSDQAGPAEPRHLWFQATADATVFPQAPAVWAHVAAAAAPADPPRDALAESRLTGPFRFASGPAGAAWTTTVAPAADPGTAARVTLGLAAAGGKAVLTFARPNVAVESPAIAFYVEPLNDPKSVPNERGPHLAAHNRTDRLLFVRRPEQDAEQPKPDAKRPAAPAASRPKPHLICEYDAGSNSYLARHATAVELYLPAEHALIDPVSVTRGNLVARQTVAFPLVEIPADPGVRFVQIRHTMGTEAKTKNTVVESAIDLTGAFDDFFPAEPTFFTGFFLQLSPPDASGRPAVVARVRSHAGGAAALTVTVDPGPHLGGLTTEVAYALAVGPTRLALPRDVNHGLVRVAVSRFGFAAPTAGVPALTFESVSARGDDAQSVFALHPWTEWGAKAGAPTTTGRAALHHRNLIQEHAEFESSFEDRFPPEGPAPDPATGRVPNPLMPLGDFVRAVRDRYTEASGNLLDGTEASRAVRNWLPHTTATSEAAVTFDPSAELPVTTFADPGVFDKQALKLRKAGEDGAELHWLDASVRVNSLRLGDPPDVTLAKADASDPLARRAVDSHVPLLFNRHDVSTLAVAPAPGDGGRVVVLVGGGDQPAVAYLLSDAGAVLGKSGTIFGGVTLRDAGLTRHGDTLRGLAVTAAGQLKRFRVTVGEASVTVDDVADVAVADATAVTCLPSVADAAAAGVVVASAVSVVNAVTGALTAVPDSAGATAAALHRSGGTLRVAFGKPDGSVVVWTQGVVPTTLPARGIGNKTAAKAIRSVRVTHDGERPLVVACDGTPSVSTWGFDAADAGTCVIVQQPAGALVVGLGSVVNLDGRGKPDVVPLFAVGLRSGEVRVSAGLPADKPRKLVEVRVFDTAAAPVVRLHVPTAAAGAAAPCLAGTSAGTVLGWDLRDGTDWPAAAFDRQTPAAVMDALGVVRAIPAPAAAAADLVIDALSQGTDEYRSLSSPAYRLSNALPKTSDGLFTEFVLELDAFKVKADGEVEVRRFPAGDFSPGGFRCRSTVTAADPASTLAAFDRWPRLDGVPFYVERLTNVAADEKAGRLTAVELTGVLVNPDEVAAGQDDADAGSEPGVVVRALSRGTPVKLRFTRTDDVWATAVVDGAVDWPMGVNRATPDAGAAGVPGAVARVRGAAALDAAGRLSVAVDLAASQALAFGRLWPFQGDPLPLRAGSVFENVGGSWRQKGFEFDAAGNAMRIASVGPPPTADLPIDLGIALDAALRIQQVTARLGADRRVAFTVTIGGTTRQAVHRLQQGDAECFVIDPTVKDETRGRGVFLLSAAGDLGGPAGGADPRRLVAALGEVAQSAGTPTIELTVGATTNTVATTVLQSTLTVHRREAGVELSLAVLGSLHVEIDLEPKQAKLSLVLEGAVGTAAGGTAAMSGLLAYRLADAVVLQALVRCHVTLDAAANTLTKLAIDDDVFWSEFVTPTTDTGPDMSVAAIRFDHPGVAGVGYRVLAMTDVEVPDAEMRRRLGFFRLGLTGAAHLRLAFRPVPPDRVPLMPELEPSRLQAPDRLGEATVRLSHRRGAGLAMRPDVPASRWVPVQAAAGNLAVEPLGGKQLLLEPVVAVGANGPLTRLRQDGWLDPVAVTAGDRLRTDGLFVLNADSAGGGFDAVGGLDARTQEGAVDPGVERDRYRGLLRAAGAQGVAVHYSLTPERPADLGFIDSPFYEQAGVPDAARNPPAAQVPAAAVPAGAAAAVPAAVAARLAASAGRYVPADLPADPNADVCCLARRGYRLRRDGTAHYGTGVTPILHVAEVPAFRDPARLADPLGRPWRATEDPFVRPFFPRRLDWELAADKPGAMFQILAQARVTDAAGNTSREPQLDFALREPQFIALKNCVTAAVAWQDETKLNPVDNRLDATLVWTETVGTVAVERGPGAVDFVPTADGGLRLAAAPLQLVVEFNGDVFAVRPADAAVPAYRIEAQKGPNDPSAPQVRTKLAATYLVSEISLDKLAAPVSVTPDKSLEIAVTKAAAFWTVPADAGVVSGSEYAVAGVPAEGLNTRHRLVAFGDKLNLTQDVADGHPDHAVGSVVAVKLGDAAVDKMATVVSRRPFCLRVSGVTPADGTTVVVVAGAGVRSLQTGVAEPPLLLAKTGVAGEYLVVTPTVAAGDGGNGLGTAVRAEVVPYFEAAVRRKLQMTVAPPRVFQSAFSIPVTQAAGLAVGNFVRVADVKYPQARGVFGLLNDPTADGLTLAQPGVAKAASATTPGTAAAFLAADAAPAELAGVRGGVPIEITTAAAPAWADGTAVAVAGVVGVPEANGTWVVRGTGDGKTFELYEPPVAGTMPPEVTQIDAVVSVVTRLDQAFAAAVAPRVPRLTYDPGWDAKDRPQLQVLWAGRMAFPAADGTGVAWRVGGALVELYEQPKQVKFLAQSLLAAKLAFVLTARRKQGPKTKLQRTILFGDGSPASEAVATVAGGVLTLEIRDNREVLSVELPSSAEDYSTKLHIVKSLPSGALIYDAR